MNEEPKAAPVISYRELDRMAIEAEANLVSLKQNCHDVVGLALDYDHQEKVLIVRCYECDQEVARLRIDGRKPSERELRFTVTAVPD